MSELVKFAENELNLLLTTCEDEESTKMQKVINENILKVVKTFSEAGHTGFTAGYALNIIDRLLRYQPISPLTGNEDEWNDVTDLSGGKTLYQNKRCPFVFKEGDRAYNSEGKIFSDDNGHTWYTCKDSKVDITFPYVIPSESERVIIDNVEERSKILDTLKDIIKSSFDKNTIEDKIINEETLLSDLLPIENFEELQTLLIHFFKITKLISPLDKNDRIWNVINTIMASEHEFDNE